MVMVLIKLPRWCVKGEEFLISSFKKPQKNQPIHLDRGKIKYL